MSRQTITMAILAVFVAGNALAQTAPPVQNPPAQQPPATAKPPAQAVPAPPAAPVQPPFPVESKIGFVAVSYTHLRAHETVLDLVCRLLLEKKNNTTLYNQYNTVSSV